MEELKGSNGMDVAEKGRGRVADSKDKFENEMRVGESKNERKELKGDSRREE